MNNDQSTNSVSIAQRGARWFVIVNEAGNKTELGPFTKASESYAAAEGEAKRLNVSNPF